MSASTAIRSFPFPRICLAGVAGSAVWAAYQDLLQVKHDKDGNKVIVGLDRGWSAPLSLLARYNHHFTPEARQDYAARSPH
jgi:hypothetical protein